MIKRLYIDNFKNLCGVAAKLSTVNILTGVNGRGKSSFLQVLLLLSQTWRSEQPWLLLPNGHWKNLGTFGDIINVYHKDKPIIFQLNTDDEIDNSFELCYLTSLEKNTLGSLKYLRVGELRIEVGNDISSDFSADFSSDFAGFDSEQSLTLGSVNDYPGLTQLKRMYYVSADRESAKNSEVVDQTTQFLMPNGSNVLNVLWQNQNVLAEVQKRMNYVLEEAAIQIESKGQDLVLSMNSVKDGHLFHPENVGYGYGYLLTLITASVLAGKRDTLIIENPEAHLHPSAQSKVTSLLIKDAKEKGYQLFIESHSDHVVNSALLEIKREESICNKDDVELLFFSNEKNAEGDICSHIMNLNITEQGRVLNPPKQFCDQYAIDLEELYS